jgi:hypothetical protein
MVVHVVHQDRTEVTQRIVGEGREVDDRVETGQRVGRDVPDIDVERADVCHLGGIAEVAGVVQVGVQADDVVSRLVEHRHQHGADIAAMAGDEDPHPLSCIRR